MNRALTVRAKCFVPSCKNTTTNSKNKLFVKVKDSIQRRWCQELNIEYIPGRRFYCCEDHLNLQEDLENYNYWKLMNGHPILKYNARLRGMKTQTTVQTEPSVLRDLLSDQNIMFPSKQSCTPEIHTMIEETHFSAPTTSSESLDQNIILPSKQSCTPEIHTMIEEKHFSAPTTSSVSTLPVKIDVSTQYSINMKNKSTSTIETMELAYIESDNKTCSSSTDISPGPSYICSYDSDTSAKKAQNQPQYLTRKQTIKIIYNDLKGYIGLPKQYQWLINYIVKQSETEVTELDIILTLHKIKLNNPVYVICDQFEMSKVTFSKSFHSGITALANFFQNLINMPTLLQIKQNQPLAFKIRYSNVQLLLDAFEIEIQKPTNPKHQALTWSQYKNANTIKYLVGSTPNGFVSYVSKGYGGRISDKALVEKCDLIEKLPFNAVIMADRGFKEIEAALSAKNIKLLRPPSVFTSKKPTKDEVLQTKVVASLRVHIERVIRRIREFRFLKPHSVVSHKHVGYLDHIVLIACGVINLQSEIIKRE